MTTTNRESHKSPSTKNTQIAKDKHTISNTRFNEVRPQRLRPRGNPMERLITSKMFKIANSLFECKRAPAKPFSQAHNPRKLTTALNTQISGTADFRPKPDCRSTGGSTDLHLGRPVGRPKNNRELGTYSQGIWTLCMLCMSVDLAVRPTCLFFCCCCYFLLLSPLPFVINFLGDHFDNPWQSCQFLGNILSFQQNCV